MGVKYFDGTSTENYYYMYNPQGDVIGLYDSDGAIVARYVYDSWGEMLDVTDANGNDIYDDEHIGNANPIRYRGYYFDEELYMYYCQSRYYMPGFARFLNADALFVSGNDLTGANMYAYCLNNPVNYADPTGCAANDFSASMANSLKVIGWIALLYQLTGSNDVVNELWSIAAGSYETFFEKAQWALEIVYVKGALGAGGASAASDVTSGVLHSLASGATQATRLRLSEATRFISLSGSGLGVRVTTISPTAAGKAATAGLKAIPYVAAVTGLAIDTYQDYNKYGGNTKEFWTATGFNVVGSAGGVAAAAAIGALIPGPGWAFAIGTATGFAISFGAEYLKRKTLGQ